MPNSLKPHNTLQRVNPQSSLDTSKFLQKLCSQTFFKPSREARLLTILHLLAENPSLSQSELGNRTGLSGAMVNAYLREMAQNLLIEYVPTNGKCFRYSLTPQGEELCSVLFTRYCTEIIQNYSAIKQNIRDKLLNLLESNFKRLVLFGASETCEVVLAAIKDSPQQIVAVVDSDDTKHGLFFHGHIVSSPAILENLVFQAIVITSFGSRNDIYQQIKPMADRNKWEIIHL